MNPLSVLVVEDSEDDMLLLVRELKQGGYTVQFERVETAVEMQTALDRQAWDIIIADYTLPNFSAPAALQLLQQRQQDLPFMIVSGTIDEETAVTAMKLGAHDYITKGNLARLIPAVERELREASERQKRQQAERDLRQSEIEKQQLEMQFYRAQRLESLGTLASGIAHDLNNVLTPILTISQLLTLQSSHLDERSQQLLKILEDSAKRGTSMIKQILTFARGTDGERQPVQVVTPLLEVLSVMQKTLPKSITIETNIPPALPELVSADATYLNQVLMNLCVNARDAMPDGGTLTLSIAPYCIDRTFVQTSLETQIGNYQEGQYVVITVADTGIGIPLEVRDRMFDPFFTTKPIGQGTGLGLASVLGIVKTYGGFLQVWSEVGQGTAIKVYLPVIESAIDSATGSSDEGQTNGQGRMILLVDDDEAVKFSTQSLLESQNYVVVSTTDGLAAIELYETHQAAIAIVILDIMMPNMSGISLIQKLKAINPQVKVMAMSGLPANRESALVAGASAFLPKPYTLRQLLAMLQTLVTAG
jgi:signal transduction histidine kinase